MADDASLKNKETEINLYAKRWIVLATFSLMSMTNEVIWISLSSITSIVKEYYGVSSVAVNWLSMVYMLFYVFVVLAAYVLHRMGLKFTIVMGAVLNGLGSTMRLIGSGRDGFWWAFLGNSLAALGQCFILFVPPTLAAVWFGERERATASAIGLLMNMLGVAVGFLMGGTLVPSSTDYDGAVRQGMFNTLMAQAVFCTLMVIACVVLIDDAPKTPPSMSQILLLRDRERRKKLKNNPPISLTSLTNLIVEQEISYSAPKPSETQQVKNLAFLPSLKVLAKQKAFHLLLQAYGLYFGVFAASNTLLNQMCMVYYPGKEKEIGLMAFVSVILGLVGIFAAGMFIDRTKRYKLISIFTCVACAIAFLAFTLTLKYSGNFNAVFACFCVFGFFSYPYLTVGLEHAAEVTYPVSEGTTSGLLLLLGNMYGIGLTYAVGALLEGGYADLAGYVFVACYVIGCLIVSVTKGDLLRLAADHSNI